MFSAIIATMPTAMKPLSTSRAARTKPSESASLSFRSTGWRASAVPDVGGDEHEFQERTAGDAAVEAAAEHEGGIGERRRVEDKKRQGSTWRR